MTLLRPAFALSLLLAAPAWAQPLPPLTLEPVLQGLEAPVALTHAGDDRLFVTLQAGQVVIVEGGERRAEPFLDITGRVLSGGERGLLSIAFHPRYRDNGFFFVNYTEAGGATILARYRVLANDPNRADPASERRLLRIAQPFGNHNGGQVAFGPDGYLYVGMGDGGSGGDPLCTAQDDGSLLGKMLRLDVDQSVDAPPYHGIPPSNPFVGPGAPRDEIWAKGLRNPWRFSFDRGTGDLFLGDVGQNTREEVSFQPAASTGGENYGWKVLEGTNCLGSTAGCGFPVPGCSSPAYTPPILTYDHVGGDCSVTGGYVYRGARSPELRGVYFYGDYCSGAIRAARRSGGSWTAQTVASAGFGLTSFGEDVRGELYVLAGDTLSRLAAPLPTVCVPADDTLCLGGGRFQVRASYRTEQGLAGPGTAQLLTPDAGYFTFFSAANPELFVKVIDACAPPFQRYWVFAAGLTDVEVTLSVVDVTAGQEQVYVNPLGQAYPPLQDTEAFATCGQ
jgi:glucose/arabinose dehydrogenase